MRAVTCLTVPVLLAAAAQAEEVSVACSVEYVRRSAIAASDYTEPSRPGTYWVSHDGQTLGPWTILQIKREMAIGRLPTGLYVHDAERATGWTWSAQSPEFDPLPGDPALGPDDLGAGLPRLLQGCWVSDPISEAAGQETVWLLLLMDKGQFFPSRGIRDLATGEEGFWFSRGSTRTWAAEARGGSEVTLHLPDINYFDPQDDFTARVIDRNTLSIDLPGAAATVFRRM